MKTTLYFLALCITIVLSSCDSATESTPPRKLAGKGSVFTYDRKDFDETNTLFDTGTTTYTIDSADMTIETQTGMMRAVSEDDTILFHYDQAGMHIYRPAADIFPNFTLPAIWQHVEKDSSTDLKTIGTYTASTTINGAPATITGYDREKFEGTGVITLNGETFTFFQKSFSVEVNVSIPTFGVNAKTTVTVFYSYSPELGFFAASSDVRTTDSEFSPIPPGRTELTLRSYSIK